MTRRAPLVVALVMVLAVALGACGSSGSSGKSNAVTPPQPVDMRGQKAVAVDAVNNTFSPPAIIVSPGTAVTWTNKDQVVHNVKKQVDTANFGSGKFGIDVADFGPGKTYSYTFDKAGTYAYMCTIHSLMTGTVTVAAAGAGTSTPTT